MNTKSSNVERLLELLTDRALFGLSADEQLELNELQALHPEIDGDEFDRIAALIELARSSSGLGGTEEPDMPSDLKQRIRGSIPASVLQTEPTRQDRQTDFTSRLVSWGGWVTAATLLLALLGRGIFSSDPLAVRSNQPSEARAELIADATDLLKLEWTSTEDDAASGASGDVVWSDTAQAGFMRFSGLASNDPSQNQYQLWIFDSEQDERYPIDGGVFDMPAGNEEVVIPISAKIAVSRPTMFAITVEKPGGVVVSNRERIPLLAKK